MNIETKYLYQGLKVSTDSLCWDCKLAGRCHKPISGWDAIYNPIQVGATKKKVYFGDSWFVISCPQFVPERWVQNEVV